MSHILKSVAPRYLYCISNTRALWIAAINALEMAFKLPTLKTMLRKLNDDVVLFDFGNVKKKEAWSLWIGM